MAAIVKRFPQPIGPVGGIFMAMRSRVVIFGTDGVERDGPDEFWVGMDDGSPQPRWVTGTHGDEALVLAKWLNEAVSQLGQEEPGEIDQEIATTASGGMLIQRLNLRVGFEGTLQYEVLYFVVDRAGNRRLETDVRHVARQLAPEVIRSTRIDRGPRPR